MDELTTHEKLCRTKYVSCPVCNEVCLMQPLHINFFRLFRMVLLLYMQEVMQEEAEGHLEAFHTKSDNNLIAL